MQRGHVLTLDQCWSIILFLLFALLRIVEYSDVVCAFNLYLEILSSNICIIAVVVLFIAISLPFYNEAEMIYVTRKCQNKLYNTILSLFHFQKIRQGKNICY